jgi:hypothetical protein
LPGDVTVPNIDSPLEKYSVNVLAPIAAFDHCVIVVVVVVIVVGAFKTYPEKNELNSFLKTFNWSVCFCFKNVDTAANMITNTILFGMKMFIPNSRKRVRKK